MRNSQLIPVIACFTFIYLFTVVLVELGRSAMSSVVALGFHWIWTAKMTSTDCVVLVVVDFDFDWCYCCCCCCDFYND